MSSNSERVIADTSEGADCSYILRTHHRLRMTCFRLVSAMAPSRRGSGRRLDGFEHLEGREGPHDYLYGTKQAWTAARVAQAGRPRVHGTKAVPGTSHFFLVRPVDSHLSGWSGKLEGLSQKRGGLYSSRSERVGSI